MKSVKVIKAHMNDHGVWLLENGKALTASAGFVIEDNINLWPDVAIAFANYPFPDNVSKLSYNKTFMLNEKVVHIYTYNLKAGRKSKTLKIFFSEDLLEHFPTKLPEEIYFKIFKI